MPYPSKSQSRSNARRRSSARRSANAFERLEQRVLRSTSPYESYDGTGNNLTNTTWGATGTDLIRITPAAYANGTSAPSLPGDASGRAISNLVNSQDVGGQAVTTYDQNSLSDFGYAFGQFIDHDLSLTPDGTESLPIAVAANDPIGPGALPFDRSAYDPTTGTSNARQQVTEVTAYLDLSQIYGSDPTTAADLRTFTGGLLKTSAGGMLPYDNTTYFTPQQLSTLNAYLGGMQNMSGIATSSLFAAGDIRGNENLELTAIVTLFVRNHNQLATKLAAEHPTWTDEQLYQEARKINIAGYQSMIYNEYLPDFLGAAAMPAYAGYNPGVDAAVSNEFSTVAFRIGHSMVSPSIARDGNNGQSVAADVPLQDDFFDPNLLNPTGATDPITGLPATDIGAVLKGEADGNGQAVDNMVVDQIRNDLFGNAFSGTGGEDLVALDIQRGRDHGMESYNAMRVSLGLAPVTSFAQITSNVAVQQELAAAYPGGVNTVDADEGGMCENHVAGSDVGPLFQAIIVNQFIRTRAGDRFFYLNESWNADELNLLNGVNTLTKVIEANTPITGLQADAFTFRTSISGTVAAPNPLPFIGAFLPPIGVGGVTVYLVSGSGQVVATTTTNVLGQYSFNQLSGMSTGTYAIVIAKGSTVAASSWVSITQGDQNFGGINFGLKSIFG